MKNKNRKNKFRKGFTLIELLMVVVVIAILAGTVMVSGDESIISAEANNIISNMRILKTAALEWLDDYSDFVDYTGVLNYMVTYPIPAIMAIDKKNLSEQCIQNLMRENSPKSGKEGRKSMMKYIPKKLSGDIPVPVMSVNEYADKGTSPTEGGYALVDTSWGFGKPYVYNKWFVVYQFENKNNSRIKKLKEKIKERAEEFGLIKDDDGNPYNADTNYVYMEIVDLATINKK